MQRIKERVKKVLKISHQTYLKPLKNLNYIGSSFHGYYIPDGYFNENSICYCVGAGIDITFDTELVVNYNAKVFIFDPAPEAFDHYNSLKDFTSRGEKFITKKDLFVYRISKDQLNTIQFIKKGLWDKDTTVKFYKPDFEDYPSHSMDLFKTATEYIEVPVDRVSNIMKELKHDTVDLLKIEIEGAEYVVLKTIVEDKPDIKMILVEFDEVYHPKDNRYLFRIKKSTEEIIKAGYTLVHSTPYFKRLFVKNDLFEKLKSLEK